MKKIASKDEKLTERAFSQGLIISVVSILLCIVVLCSITYAWFTADVSSKSSTLVSGQFSVTITVKSEDGATSFSVDKVADKDGVYTCALPAGGTYNVTLKVDNGTTVKGHCIVKIGSEEKRTAAIIGEYCDLSDGGAVNDPFMFKIKVAAATTVTFEPRWGVSASAEIGEDETFEA